MTAVTINGYIYHDQNPDHTPALAAQYDWAKPKFGFSEGTFHVSEYWPNRVLVQPHSFTVDIPDNFDPTQPLVEGLREVKRRKLVEQAQEIAVIDEKINKLLALTN